MLNLRGPAATAPGPNPPAWSATRADRYCGPDRRRSAATPLRHWLAAALDELDYGVLLLTTDAEILHVNHAAGAELDAGHPLQRVGRQLRTRLAQDVAVLHDALRNASQRQLRKLITFGEGANQVGVSVVPLGACEAAADAPILLVLGKRRVCESLSVEGFARSHRLTGAETRVLTALCRGVPPTGIADELGVAISTVRSHIGTIRAKTGAESIRALVRQVAQLPPLMGVLRHMAASIAEGPAEARAVDAAARAEAEAMVG